MTAISNSRFSELYTPQLASAVPQPQSARLEVATELPGTRQTSLQDKDQWLASIYGGTLRDLLGDNQDYREVEVDRIPWNSSLGQTRALMLKLLGSPAFKDWAKQNDVDLSKPLTINVDSGTLDVTTTGAKQRNPFDFSPPTPTAKSLDIHSFTGWPLLMSVAKTLAGPGNVVSFDTASTATTATIADIARFHGHAVPSDRILSPSQRQASIQQLLDKLQDPDSDTYNERFNFPPQQYLNNQVSELGGLNNRNAVIGVISNVVNEKAKDLEDLEAELQFWQKRSGYEETIEKLQLTIKQRLQNVLDTPVEIDPTSSYFRDHNLKPDVAVTLRDYLVGHGIVLPTNASELKNIAQSLASPPIEKPAHGNLGGAHSWPTPMSNDDRRALAAMTSKFLEGQPENTLLAYLTRGVEYRQNFGASFLEDRSRGIDNVLEFPNVKKFALAAEREFGEIASPNVIADWMLTALYDSLDPLSINATSPDSNRTKVAGFDLANMNLSGMNAQDIYATLSDHLRETGVTNHYNGVLAMEVLLARKAPELLVKDIPETLTKGTHSWVSFVTAVARIEAEAPGSTSRMTYAQVMMRHELAPITLADKLVEQQAQTDALKDWGVYNGVLTRSSTDQYSEEDMTKVRAAFNEQMHQLNESSKTFATPFPVLHEMAVASIKEQNPHLSEEQIKRKVLTPKDSGFLEFPGPYSLVDILINAERHHKDVALDSYTSSDKDIDLSTIALRKFTNSFVVSTFEAQLSVLFDRFERATQTQVKNLISKLPVEDRNIIEHGKITVSREVDVTYSGASSTPVGLEPSPHSIIVQSEFVDASGRKGIHTYEIDGPNNIIRKREDLNDKTPATIPGIPDKSTGPLPPVGDSVVRTRSLIPIVPDGDYKEDVLAPRSNDNVNNAPNSFASEKTQYIADALVKKISIRDNAESLRGTTAFDGEVPFWQKIEDFVVGLIPGYNAVKNFIAGNWREGLIDVAFDVFGFLLAGAGGAVRAAGAGARAGSSAFGSTAKRLVRGAIGALNPIDPKGIAQGFVQEGITYLANSGPGRNNQPSFKIKYDPVKIFRNVENATIGNANMQGTTTAIAATQKNGKWYALDPVSKQPFGLPLKDFVPSA